MGDNALCIEIADGEIACRGPQDLRCALRRDRQEQHQLNQVRSTSNQSSSSASVLAQATRAASPPRRRRACPGTRRCHNVNRT